MITNIEKGLKFELACRDKLITLGFTKIKLTSNTDNGADIIATLGKTKYVFQCKNHIKTKEINVSKKLLQ